MQTIKITKLFGCILRIRLTNIGVALGGSIELGHIGDLEAFDELRPNLRPQAIPENGANLVLGVLGRRLCGQHIATHFPDVLSDL